VAVHSGGTSAPRAQSLEDLSAGKLQVICAVDVFNEGLDLVGGVAVGSDLDGALSPSLDEVAELLSAALEVEEGQARPGNSRKAYVFHREDGTGAAFVGSSNLSEAAL